MENLLTKEEISSLKSMALYWDEVDQRDNKQQVSNVAARELAELHFSIPPIKILSILSNYAKSLNNG